LELQRTCIDLVRVIDAAVETSRPQIEDAGLRLGTYRANHSIWVDGDFTRLTQVFSNILNNAAKYGRGPGAKDGVITLDVHERSDSVAVSIRDTGIGIEHSALSKVFEMFSQVGPALGGLGIGLSLAKRLVEMHGGTIEAHSSGHQKGSEFIVGLPLTVTAPVQNVISGDGTLTRPSCSLRIVVADDNPDIVFSFRVMLEAMGYLVWGASSGTEAFELAGKLIPDVVVLDIGMPDVDGYETALRIREQPWGRGMVLIAITGWGQERDKRRSEEVGFAAHLVKPVDAKTIIGCLEATNPQVPPTKPASQHF
jgi:CheY-like chemotaxis protein